MTAFRFDANNIFYKFILAGLVAVPVALFFIFNGTQDLLRTGAPEGQLFYLGSKIAGLCAFILLWWQCLTALFNHRGDSTRRYAPGKRLHIIFGLSLLVVILLHASFFVTAVSLRSEQVAWHVLVPAFTKGYYVIALSLGIFALLMILMAMAAGLLRKRFPQGWKFGHALVFVVVILASMHAYMIGTEMQSDLFLPLFWFVVVSALVGGFLRFFSSGKTAIKTSL